jgi:hypothetical protein
VLFGAFLLFAVQPLAGKIVTPIFGGTAGVWCLLLVFFQLVVLSGYALTYSITKLSPKLQSAAFAIIWLGCAALVGCTPDWFAGTIDPAHPELSLAGIAAATLGVPCIALATIGGTVQVWHKWRTGKDPYFLYSISNIGSLGALLLFPSLLEPWLHTSTMVASWRIGFLLLCGLCLYIALATARSAPAAMAAEAEAAVRAGAGSFAAQPPSRCEASRNAPPLGSPLVSDQQNPIAARTFAWWCSLSALGCALLLEITSFITQDVAPAPLLWIPPLAAYLLTFIITFAGERYYNRELTIITVLVAAAIFPFVDFTATRLPLAATVGVATLLLISGCFLCNGELYRSRPQAQRLPTFYLAIATGGAIGGMGIMLAAPLVLSVFAERLLILLSLTGVAIFVAIKFTFGSANINRIWSGLLPIAMAVGIMSPFLAVWLEGMQARTLVQESRNFYGTVKITKQAGRTWLYHGRTIHGMQYADAARKSEILEYYTGAISAIDEVMRALRNAPVNYGIVGLGAGSLASYGLPGDTFTFYELDPKVEPIARRHFSFLQDSPARINIILGDARRSLADEKAQPFNLLIVDAFNSDAIPIHLLTVEALHLYASRITPDGAIVFHTTNRYLNLAPIISAEAQTVGFRAATLQKENVRFVLLTRNEKLLDGLAAPCQKRGVSLNINTAADQARPWTDDFSNLLAAFRQR